MGIDSLNSIETKWGKKKKKKRGKKAMVHTQAQTPSTPPLIVLSLCLVHFFGGVFGGCVLPIFPFRARFTTGQRLKCLPNQTMRGFGGRRKCFVSGSAGTPATGQHAHKGCRLHMGRHATVDTNTHGQVNKHTHSLNRQTPHKNTTAVPLLYVC